MKSALIPADMGDKKTAWTCVGPQGCNGVCVWSRRAATDGHGTAEALAEEHAAQKRLVNARVHVVESGRGRTFKVWGTARGYASREVL